MLIDTLCGLDVPGWTTPQQHFLFEPSAPLAVASRRHAVARSRVIAFCLCEAHHSDSRCAEGEEQICTKDLRAVAHSVILQQLPLTTSRFPRGRLKHYSKGSNERLQLRHPASLPAEATYVRPPGSPPLAFTIQQSLCTLPSEETAYNLGGRRAEDQPVPLRHQPCPCGQGTLS